MSINRMRSRYPSIKKASILSASVNGILAVLKIVIGFLGQSQALIADGLHSFSDLVVDGMVLAAAKAGNSVPDREHPYGHHRIETLGSIAIALVLIAVASSLAYHTTYDLIKFQISAIPSLWVIVAAFISLLVNEGLYRYLNKIGKSIQSNLLISNAWHNRGDAFVSGLVLISALGTRWGFSHLDLITAILIALLIFKMSIGMLLSGINELIDAGTDKETLAKISECIANLHGVVSIHQLRTRLHGGNIFVDVHIIVNPLISVSEGHHIGEKVHHQLLKSFKNIADVVVHIDPEDDENSKPSLHLPSRNEIENILNNEWGNLPGYAEISKTTLHYLNGEVFIDLFLPQHFANMDLKNLSQQYQAIKEKLDYIASIRIHFMAE